MITIPRNVCRQADQALQRGWLVPIGPGSYASSTISDARTRPYRGLLVTSLASPLARTLLVAKVAGKVEVGGRTNRLGTNEYVIGVTDPDGFLFLKSAIINGIIPSLEFSGAAFEPTETAWMDAKSRDWVVTPRIEWL